MSFLFSRPFYVAFGAAGFGLDYIAHYLTARVTQLPNPEMATFKLVAGWNDVFLATGKFELFTVGVVAHSMFFVAFALLAIRGK